MAHSHGKYTDFEGLRERAVALRRRGHSLRQIRDELKIFNNDILNQLVKGEPPPEWSEIWANHNARLYEVTCADASL